LLLTFTGKYSLCFLFCGHGAVAVIEGEEIQREVPHVALCEQDGEMGDANTLMAGY
jgi:hypothetical protein